MENTLFPGRSDYTGPTSGVFGLLHHDLLVESSHDVNERIDYVRHNKSAREIEVRLHNMIYLGGCPAAVKCALLDADLEAKLAPLSADYAAGRYRLRADYLAKLTAVDADYKAKCIPLDADYNAGCDRVYTDYIAKLTPLHVDYDVKRYTLNDDYRAKIAPLNADILAYIREKIPDCAWDGKELRFS